MNIYLYSQKLEKAQSQTQIERCLHDYLLSFDIRSYAFTFYSGHIKTGRKLRYHFVSDALRIWHVHYLEQKYADVDRTLEDINKATLPVFWDVHEQLAQAKNKRERRIRKESIQYDIDKGLCIPLHGANQEFINLTLHQRRGESCLKQYKSNQLEWISATHLFYHYIKKFLNVNLSGNPDCKLTLREKQCLALTAKTWRVEQIAKELNISVHTVNFHIQNANKKIGTNNKYQSVYKYLEISE